MAVTLRQLAEQLNLSAATISMVLNNKPGISQETRDRVMEAVRASGYSYKRPSAPRRQSGALGFIIYKKHGQLVGNTPFFSVLIENIEHAAGAMGFTLNVAYMSDGDLERISRNHCEGLLLLGTEMDDNDLAPFLHQPLPLVVLDNSFRTSPVNSVSIDNFGALQLSVDALLARGHRRIGYLRSSVDITNFQERFAGYQAAMSHAGLPVLPEDIITLPPTIEGSAAGMRQWLTRHAPGTDAYVADMDFIAIGAMQALAEAGIRCGRDLSLIGFDNISLAAAIDPPLSSVRVYHDALGATAVRRLSELITTPSQMHTHIAVGTSLELRESVL